jgi:ankyrin repeat protein
LQIIIRKLYKVTMLNAKKNWKVNPDNLDHRGKTALMCAVQSRSVEILLMLLETSDSDTWNVSLSGTTVLIYASIECVQAVRGLARTGFQSAGMTKIYMEYVEIFHMLLETGNGQPGNVCVAGMTALMHASMQCVEPVRMLLATGDSKPGNVSIYGMTALMFASQGGCLEIVRMLLDTGESKPGNVSIISGMTALMFASQGGCVEIVSMLLDTGESKPGNVNISGMTALLYAIHIGNFEIVRLLLETGESNVGNIENSETALIIASRFGNREVVRLLLESGESKPGHIDRSGKNALIYALHYKHLEIAIMLLPLTRASGIDKFGISTLMHSFRSGDVEIVRVLLASGESNPRYNYDGKSTLYYAMVYHRAGFMTFDTYKLVRSLIIRRIIVDELQVRRLKLFAIVRWWSRLQNLGSPTSNQFFHVMGGNFKGLTFDELKTESPNVTAENYSFYLLGCDA